MGYFSNGSEGCDFQAQFCEHCVHDINEDCPVLLLHLMWNYDAVGEDKDDVKETALKVFISGSPQRCVMYHKRTAEDEPSKAERETEQSKLRRWIASVKGE